MNVKVIFSDYKALVEVEDFCNCQLTVHEHGITLIENFNISRQSKRDEKKNYVYILQISQENEMYRNKSVLLIPN